MNKEEIKNKVMGLEYKLAELAQLLSEDGQSIFKINTVVGSWTWNKFTTQPEYKGIEGLKSDVEKELEYFDTESLFILNGKRSDYSTIEDMLEKVLWTKLSHLNSRNLLERFQKWWNSQMEIKITDYWLDEFIESELGK